MKKKYLPPLMIVEMVEMENSIAAGSAKINPTDSNGELTSEWENQSDIELAKEW